MKTFYILFIFILFSTEAISQFIGGVGDGYRSYFTTEQNSTPGIYSGDANDGQASYSTSLQNHTPEIYRGGGEDGAALVTDQFENTTPLIYMGGSNDGISITNAVMQNASPGIYAGGNSDGMDAYAQDNQNAVLSIYKGGDNDGADFNFAAAQNSLPGIYAGGAGDGFASRTTWDNPSTFYYIFTGTGYWDVASNWLDNNVPPSLLPPPREIIINPSSGSCTINVVQTLLAGSRLTIAEGKVFVVPGSIH